MKNRNPPEKGSKNSKQKPHHQSSKKQLLTKPPDYSMPQFQLDLTASAKPAIHLLQKTEKMRQWIRKRREEKQLPQVLTYGVRCSKIGAVGAVTGHSLLRAKKDDPDLAKITGDKMDFDEEKKKENSKLKQQNRYYTVVLTISTKTIYPESLGYGIYKNNQVLQCYNIWIDKACYTLVGVVYPNWPSYQPNLSDLLGILVAEQIRFDTLRALLSAYPGVKHLNVDQLYFHIFSNFKRRVYNNWAKTWEENERAQRLAEEIGQIEAEEQGPSQELGYLEEAMQGLTIRESEVKEEKGPHSRGKKEESKKVQSKERKVYSKGKNKNEAEEEYDEQLYNKVEKKRLEVVYDEERKVVVVQKVLKLKQLKKKK